MTKRLVRCARVAGLAALAAALAFSAACFDSQEPDRPPDTRNRAVNLHCTSLDSHPTLKQFIAQQRATPQVVEQGCGYTVLLFSGIGGPSVPSEPVVGMSYPLMYLQGWASFFDSNGKLVGEVYGDDSGSGNPCKGKIPPDCASVTRCALDPSYPKTGELCMHSKDAGSP